jgi:hypothetical protein
MYLPDWELKDQAFGISGNDFASVTENQDKMPAVSLTKWRAAIGASCGTHRSF